MKNDATNLITASRIDELGALLKQIKALTDKADAIKNDIKDFANLSGDRKFKGDVYEVLYVESNRSVVDYKALCVALGITAEQVAEYTKTTAVFSVKVTSR